MAVVSVLILMAALLAWPVPSKADTFWMVWGLTKYPANWVQFDLLEELREMQPCLRFWTWIPAVLTRY